ncbi:MAG: HipA N-terminal domain-containing protein [Candidatus Acidiferrales bacterium]
MMNKLWRYRYKTPPPTLLVFYQDTHVAELQEFAEGGYVFRYLPAFREMNLSPFPGLSPDKGDILFSELPAFFQERLPDMRRPEIRELVQQSGIPETDKLRLLAQLGSFAITDPFEFRLKAATA